ncbi:PilZ domain-containing protein [Candidatus Nitrospira bockiana]
MFQERRRHTRFPLHASVSFIGAGIVGTGTMYNVSRGGCAVTTYSPIIKTATLRLLLYVAEEEPLVVEEGSVRWTDGYKFGLEFIMMRVGDHTRLQRYLEKLEVA